MTVHVQGLDQLRRNADLQHLVAPAFKMAMEQIAHIGLAVARSAAPVGATGQTQAKMRTRMSHRPLPLWVAVETTATRSSQKYPRYSYPKRLEFDPKLHHAGWMRGGIKGAFGRFETALKSAAKAIESRWGAR
jgi:hypothetical protein